MASQVPGTDLALQHCADEKMRVFQDDCDEAFMLVHCSGLNAALGIHALSCHSV
jgi:hypothetical protein